MAKQNLYWPIYMNLEKELIALSNSIMFDDADGSHQLDTYSPKISELLLRCAIEIESISKDLYYENGGVREFKPNGEEKEPKFDYQCLKLLNDTWQICSKQVLVTSANFYFTKPENKVITPLKGVCDKDGNMWNSAYQAVKHYRATSMNQATVKNLIHAMAALYLLNIYYRDEKTLYRLGRRFGNIAPIEDDNVVSFNSEVFSLRVHQYISMGSDVPRRTGRAFPDAVYIRKYTDPSIQSIVPEWFESNKEIIKKRKEILAKRPEVKEFLDNGGTLSSENAHLILQALGKPLLEKMNVLKLFEDKKAFLINNPKIESVTAQAIDQIFPDCNITFENKVITKHNIEAICIIVGTLGLAQVVNSEFMFSDTPEYKKFVADGGVYDTDHFFDVYHYFGKPLFDEMTKLSTLEEKIDFISRRPDYRYLAKSLPSHLTQVFPGQSIEFDGETLSSENIEPICILVGAHEFAIKHQKKLDNFDSKLLSDKPTEVILNKGQRLYSKVVLPADWIF